MSRLGHINKRSITDFNRAEARGWTIDCMILIEEIIDEKIANHFKPSNEHDFKTILLNSSILDFGSKLKTPSSRGFAIRA